MYYYFSFTFTPDFSFKFRHFNKKIQKSEGESQEHAKISNPRNKTLHFTSKIATKNTIIYIYI